MYGLEADASSLKALPSYDDQNVLFSCPAGRFVLKAHRLCHTGQDGLNLEAQNEAMVVLAAAGINCPVVSLKVGSAAPTAEDLARPLPPPIGALTAAAAAADPSAAAAREAAFLARNRAIAARSAYSYAVPALNGGVVCRLLRFLPGALFVDAPSPKPLALYRSLGAYLGALDKALQVRYASLLLSSFCRSHPMLAFFMCVALTSVAQSVSHLFIRCFFLSLLDS